MFPLNVKQLLTLQQTLAIPKKKSNKFKNIYEKNAIRAFFGK